LSTPLILLKPEDLNTPAKRGKYTVCIVGCGQVGILHTVLFAEAGFKVVCFDSDQTVVSNLIKGKAPFLVDEIRSKMRSEVRNKQITATNDIKEAVSSSNVIVVTIPVKIDSKKQVDYSTVESMFKKIGQSLVIGSLVVVTRLTGLGLVEGTIKEVLENASGLKMEKDFGLAYSPYQSVSGQRMIAASDKNTLDIASAVLEPIAKGELKKTNNMKAAQAAALFTVQRQDLNLAFKNELTQFCEKACLDYLEVEKLLKGNADDSLSTSALSNALSKDEPYILLAEAENLNLKLRIGEVARDINEQAAKHAANLVKDALRSCGKTPKRARIALLGISETPDLKGSPKRIVKELVQVLTTRGCRITLYDPYFSEGDLADFQVRPKKSLAEAIEGSDCIVIMAQHDQFRRLNLAKLKLMMRRPSGIVDLEGIVEPGKVEKEGFIYRGLGRGVWTK
jgi:UDP-N-acetyl-D-mannosaminuronic acid dehydrogenase